eukprot:1414731-Alexandrium_andersonii.AAC.1
MCIRDGRLPRISRILEWTPGGLRASTPGDTGTWGSMSWRVNAACRHLLSTAAGPPAIRYVPK